ncbi:RNA-dependent RNA polymerase 6 [Nymphaea thermarum]|nr:RNA-dependent RNA polymerase 6 [Nymphaea thermarum]
MHVKTNQISECNVEVRRLVITPTKAICLPPEVELANRVLRKYRNIADGFIRVTFMVGGKQLLSSSAFNCNIAPILKKMSAMPYLSRTTIFRRVKGIVQNGFTLCGRHYSFLAFSSNQLRGRSAWFFAEDKRITAESIRTWMGKFNNKNVAKCAARMGQCFSSTYATVYVPFSEVNFKIPDIERNGYNFSDGIGTISPELAVEVVSKLQLTGEQPSALQIRYSGCKGVSDDAFMKLQELMVFKFDEMLKNTNTAFEVLTTSCCDLESTAAIMLSAGADPQFEPHLKNLIPARKTSAPPMDYTPAPPKESPCPDVMEFFTKSTLSDSLGKIFHAHVVHADLSELGANDEKCVKLAELVAIAVDFPKTGVNAQLPQALRPKVYPDFMGKDEKQSYRSEKVLGHLYRTVLGTHGEITVEADHGAGENLLFDDQLKVPGFEKFLEEGWNCKCFYDRLLKGRILHYDVHTEGELVTGYFVSLSKHNSKKQIELKDKVGHAYTSIKKELRTTFETIEEGFNLSDDERKSVLEQKATAWYHVTYHPHWVEKTMELKDPEYDEVQLLLSFPWIAVECLTQ